MKITVITVCYNAKTALKKTIDSVLSQDYQDIEYIIVDGLSTDGTAEFLSSHSSSFRFISEKDNGLYDAMNKGVRMATGDYCIFMNAGDTFHSTDTVNRIVLQMENNDVVYGDIFKNGAVKRSLSPRNCHKMYYCHQAVFVRRSCLVEFPFDCSHRYSADFKQAKLLYLNDKRFKQTDIVVADYDTTGISNTNRKSALWDSISVIWETDSLLDKLRFIPRLLVPYIMCWCRTL